VLARVREILARVDEDDALVLGTARYWEARFAELLGDDPHLAWRLAAEAVRQSRKSGDRRILASGLGTLADCARRLSLVAEGEAAAREGVALAEAVPDDPTVRDYLRQYLATMLAEVGADDRLPEARELAGAVVAQAAPGSPYHGLGSVSMALATLRQGDVAAAEVHARAGRETLRALGMRSYFPHVDGALLRVLVRKGDPAAGAIADEALDTVDTLGPLGVLDLPLRLHALRAHLAAGRREDAVRGLGRALPLLARQAAAIPDPELRERFLSAVPENVALLDLSRELGLHAEEAPGAAGPHP
jgi:hypothetical protein